MDELEGQDYSQLTGIEAESERACNTKKGRATLLEVRAGLDELYDYLARPNLEAVDQQCAMREIYERVICCSVIQTAEEREISDLLQAAGGPQAPTQILHLPFVTDALGVFHEIAVDPKSDEVVAMHALGNAIVLGGNPLLLEMGEEADPCVEMMLETVRECRENGRRLVRARADRAAIAFVYDAKMLRHLDASHVNSVELTSPAYTRSWDQTRDGHRIEAFQAWMEQTRDVEGRKHLVWSMHGDFERCDVQIIANQEARQRNPKAEPINPYIIRQRDLLRECLRIGYAML